MSKPQIAVIGLKGLPAHGGAATVGQKIVDELTDRVQFTIYATANNAEDHLYNGHKQIIVPSFGKGGINTLIYYALSALHVLFFGNYRLVHLHHYSSGFIAPLLSLKCKVITTFHGIPRTADPKFGRLTNVFLRKNLDWSVIFSNTIISVSKPDIGELKVMYSKHGQKFQFVPNGMENVEMPQVDPKDHLVFAAGRIYDIKGLHLILEAMHQMVSPPKLVVIGNLDHSMQYKALIEKLANGLQVEFVGMIKDKALLYSKIKEAKSFIFPSLTEAMSMMLLEVASLKVPIIASDIPANKAVFSEQEVLYFQSDNSTDLLEKIETMISRPEIAENKVELAFQTLKKRHNWNKIADSYYKLYNHD